MKRRFTAAMLTLCMAASFLSADALALTPTLSYSETYRHTGYYAELCNTELSGDWHTDIVNVALTQVGYHEGNTAADYHGANYGGANNFIEYSNAWFNMNGEWCAMFVSWCAREAHVPTYAVNTAVRAASDGRGGKTKYYFHMATKQPDSYQPQPGDLVFFDYVGYGTQHVGLVAKLTDSGFYTVEGNCLNAVRVMYYDYTDPTVKYFGVYDQYGLKEKGTVKDFSVTELEFRCRDGTRGLLPDSDRDRYTFQALLAVEGAIFALPKSAYVRDNAVLLGYHVQRSEDGKWLCSDQIWRSAEDVMRGRELLTVRDGDSWRFNGVWTSADKLIFYAVWDMGGESVKDSSAAGCFQRGGDDWLNPYGDVSKSDWFYTAYRDAYLSGAYRGVSAAQPNKTATRGDFITMLYRLAGSPDMRTAAQPFSDLHLGDDCYDAACWAYRAGIAAGMGDGTFGADGALTREQALTLLFRLAAPGTSGGALPFSDASSVSSWAADAAAYASAMGWVQGVPTADGGVALCPQAEMSRAQAVSFAMRAADMLRGK